MPSAQTGIFAMGTASHAYLEFDQVVGQDARRLVTALADRAAALGTESGLNLVVGLRPELWRSLAADTIPAALTGFNAPLRGVDDFSMPASQHDAFVWLAGGSYDKVFDTTRDLVTALDGIASLATETTSWPYRDNRDLIGFIDGSENPPLTQAPDVALIPAGEPGAGGSVLLFQKWVHLASWAALPDPQQEVVIGRSKADSIEFEHKAADSHVARTDQASFGNIFRRNMPYGDASEHGTMFVGFCAEQKPLAAMLESMAGLSNGVRDALTRYTTPLTGAYYFVPAAQGLLAFATPAQD